MAKSIKKKKIEETAKPKSSPAKSKSSAKGLTSIEIVKKKIRNKNDVITEEVMKNVRIDSSVPRDKAHEPLPIPNTTDRPKDEDKDNKMSTPWDVISE